VAVVLVEEEKTMKRALMAVIPDIKIIMYP